MLLVLPLLLTSWLYFLDNRVPHATKTTIVAALKGQIYLICPPQHQCSTAYAPLAAPNSPKNWRYIAGTPSPGVSGKNTEPRISKTSAQVCRSTCSCVGFFGILGKRSRNSRKLREYCECLTTVVSSSFFLLFCFIFCSFAGMPSNPSIKSTHGPSAWLIIGFPWIGNPHKQLMSCSVTVISPTGRWKVLSQAVNVPPMLISNISQQWFPSSSQSDRTQDSLVLFGTMDDREWKHDDVVCWWHYQATPTTKKY